MIKGIEKNTHSHTNIAHSHSTDSLLWGWDTQICNGTARQLPNKKRSQIDAMKIKDYAESKMNIVFLSIALLSSFLP